MQPLPKNSGELTDKSMLSQVLYVASLCHPKWESLGQITLHSNISEAWQLWRDQIFFKVLSPTLHKFCNYATCSWNREIVACDLELNRLLPFELAERSRAAGAALLRNFCAPTAERTLTHYAKEVERGTAAGHLVTAIGIRGAMFHFSPVFIKAAYVLMEIRGSNPSLTLPSLETMLNECLTDASGTTMELVAA